MKNKSLPVYNIEDFIFSQDEKNFYSSTIKNHLKKHDFIHLPHKHDFFLTLLFTRGRGVHEIDFIKHEVKPGSIFMMAPGQVHDWNLSDDTEGYVFFHTRDFYDLNYSDKKVRNFPFFCS